uniref:Secreted phosphoprotein 1 n=1 Tax=Panagrellus redivivus TaxID=6233 RepID=A0A7E4W6H7_PANRE
MKLVVVIAVLLSAVDGLPFRYSRFRRNVDPMVQDLELELLRNDADDYRVFNPFHPSDNVIYGLPGEAGRVAAIPDPREGIENAVIRDVFFEKGGSIPNPFTGYYDQYGNLHLPQDETFGSTDDEAHFNDFDSDEIGTGARPIIPGKGHHNRKPIIKDVKRPIQIGDGAGPSSSEEVTPPATIDNYDDGLVADDSDSVEHDQPKLHSKEDDGLEDDDAPIGTGAHVKPVKPIKVPTLPFTKKPINNKNPIGNKFTGNSPSASTPEPDSSKYIAPNEDSDLINDEDKNPFSPVRHIIQLSSKTKLIVEPDGVALLSLPEADYRVLREVFEN